MNDNDPINGHDIVEALAGASLADPQPAEPIAAIAEAMDALGEPVKKQKGIAALPISLDREQQVFEMKLREPGIIRFAAIHLEQPKVLGSALRNVQLVQPVLFVECDPDRDVRTRRFMWVPSDAIIKLNPGVEAQWRATAVAAPHVRHLFELVQVPS